MMFPEIGIPASIHCGSDSNPGSVAFIEKNVVGVQMDKWRVVSGGEHDGSAEYEYERDPYGAMYYFRWRNAKWEPVVENAKGRWVKGGYGSLGLGYRRRYYDPHF